MSRAYTPRRRPPKPEVDAKSIGRRARAVELRLRMCAPEDSDLYRKIRKGCKEASGRDPAERLTALLDLADELRPLLPAAVVEHTLPSFEGWRP
jgi:hypothetical protein